MRVFLFCESSGVAEMTRARSNGISHILKSVLMVLDMNLVLHQEGQRMPPPLGMCPCVFNVSLYEKRGFHARWDAWDPVAAAVVAS